MTKTQFRNKNISKKITKFTNITLDPGWEKIWVFWRGNDDVEAQEEEDETAEDIALVILLSDDGSWCCEYKWVFFVISEFQNFHLQIW